MTISTQPHVLLRWDSGLVHSGAGREQYVEVRGIKTHEAAQELADSLSKATKGTRSTTRVSGEVFDGDDMPVWAYNVADGFAGGQVQSISVSQGPNGQAISTIEGGDPLRIVLEQWDRRIARANANSPSEWTSPFPDGKPADQPSTTIPSFTWQNRTPSDDPPSS